MSPDGMNLPESEKALVSSNVLLRKEWVMDPPPWIISRLPDDLILDIYRIKVRHFAELAKIEGQIKELESKMYNEVVKAMR
ncbi:MAG: hypothetical protein ABFS10_12790 [Bacteroidota bacterium]